MIGHWSDSVVAASALVLARPVETIDCSHRRTQTVEAIHHVDGSWSFMPHVIVSCGTCGVLRFVSVDDLTLDEVVTLGVDDLRFVFPLPSGVVSPGVGLVSLVAENLVEAAEEVRAERLDRLAAEVLS